MDMETEVSVAGETIRVDDPSVASLNYVGFRRRAGARVLDLIIHYLAGFIVAFMIAIIAVALQRILGRSAANTLQSMEHPVVPGFFYALVGFCVYEIVMEGLHGSTFGKRLCGIVVLSEDHRPCGIRGAIIRSLAFIFDGLFFGLVADMSMRNSTRQQRFGDVWARTVVVTRVSAPPSSIRGSIRFMVVLFVAVALDGAVISFEALRSLLFG
jgi:uncharacterized RDD family membrane protein YckC